MATVGLTESMMTMIYTAAMGLSIGATALVTECYRPEERAKVQAANDFLVFGSVAVASFSSGSLLNSGGWEMVNWLVFPPVAIALALLLWRAWGAGRAVPA